MAQTRLKSGNLHMVGGDNGSDGNVLKSKGDGTMEWGTVVVNPTFSSFDYPGDDTALDPAGNQSLVINGGGFNANVTVTIDGTTCPSITRNSATQLTVTTPAKSAGSQILVITNTDGGSANTNVSYNGVPAWTTSAGSLGSIAEGETINLTVTATEPDGGTITYAITSGSLPSGASLNTSTGAITGTAASVSADTTSSFTITATDNENQSTARAFTITITAILPSGMFKAVTYTGNGGTQSITGVGFKPDLVWIKNRSTVASHLIHDSSRGAGGSKGIYPGSNKSQGHHSIYGSVSSFDTDGFAVDASSQGHHSNRNGDNYIAWCFKANGGTTSSNSDGNITSTVQVNDTLGFSIAEWTSTSSSSHTIGHGLSGKPDAILYKKISADGNWFLYTDVIDGSWDELTFSGTDAKYDYSATYGTSTTFRTVSASAGADWITYSFKSVAGFSKIGKYTAVSGDNFIETGFKPKFLMIKCTSHGSTHWEILDSTRSPGLLSNGSAVRLRANDDSVDASFNDTPVRFLSNGFMLKKSVTLNNYGDYDTTGRTFFYMAFADDPTATTPTLADSFNTKAYTGTGNDPLAITGVGFQPDLVWIKTRTQSREHIWSDVVRGLNKELSSSDTAAQESRGVKSFDANGFTLDNSTHNYNNNGENYISWAWKAGELPSINTDGNSTSIVSVNSNAGFSIVRYIGNQTAGHTIGHGLGAVPEMIILKSINAVKPWYVYHAGVDASYPAHYNLRLSADDARQNSTTEFNDTAPTSSVFTLGTASGPNGTGDRYIAYCFRSISGYSKFGSYTGVTSGVTVNVGFQPDFVMVKSASNVEHWAILDSTRGSQKVLYPNRTNAESNTALHTITFSSTGFSFPHQDTADAMLNENGYTYIYAAFKIN